MYHYFRDGVFTGYFYDVYTGGKCHFFIAGQAVDSGGDLAVGTVDDSALTVVTFDDNMTRFTVHTA